MTILTLGHDPFKSKKFTDLGRANPQGKGPNPGILLEYLHLHINILSEQPAHTINIEVD